MKNRRCTVHVGLRCARPNNNIWKIPDVSSMWGFAALAPIIWKIPDVSSMWGFAALAPISAPSRALDSPEILFNKTRTTSETTKCLPCLDIISDYRFVGGAAISLRNVFSSSQLIVHAISFMPQHMYVADYFGRLDRRACIGLTIFQCTCCIMRHRYNIYGDIYCFKS